MIFLKYHHRFLQKIILVRIFLFFETLHHVEMLSAAAIAKHCIKVCALKFNVSLHKHRISDKAFDDFN